MLELSLVIVPANPRALLTQKGIQDAIEAEVIDELELNELGILLDKLVEPEAKIKDVYFDQLSEIIVSKIRPFFINFRFLDYN